MYKRDKYGDFHKAPCSIDGHSKSLVQIANGELVEGYFEEDIERMYDYDNGFSKIILKQIIRSVIHGKIPTVTIYRCFPNFVEDKTINDGDWVCLSPQYARTHGNLRYTDDYTIVKKSVFANQIYWDMEHLSEYGYDTKRNCNLEGFHNVK